METQANVNEKCGFVGPRWTTDSSAHTRWCRGANSNSVKEETNSRVDGLARSLVCRPYTQTAVALAQEAQQLQCGFSGPMWVTSFFDHESWCRNKAGQNKIIGHWGGRLYSVAFVGRNPEGDTGERRMAYVRCGGTPNVDGGLATREVRIW